VTSEIQQFTPNKNPLVKKKKFQCVKSVIKDLKKSNEKETEKTAEFTPDDFTFMIEKGKN
jgi:hypothetical protein